MQVWTYLFCHIHSPATSTSKYLITKSINMVLLTSRGSENVQKYEIHWDITQYYIIQRAEHHVEVMAALSCSCLSLCFCFICLYSCTTLPRSSSIILFLAIEGLLTDIGLWPRRELRRRPLVAPWRKDQDDNNEQTALISISKRSRVTNKLPGVWLWLSLV